MGKLLVQFPLTVECSISIMNGFMLYGNLAGGSDYVR